MTRYDTHTINRRRRTMLARVTVLVLALLLAGSTPGLAQGKQKVVVVFAHAQVAPTEEVPLWAVPEKMGWFAEEGLEVEFQWAGGSSAALQVLASGTAQFAHSDKTSLIGARDKGVKVKAVLNLQRVWPYSIAVLPDSPIKSTRDLKGKTIGVPSLASGAVPYVRQVYRATGLDIEKDMKLVAAGTGARAAAALTSGQIDALGLWGGAYAVIEGAGTKLRYMQAGFEEKISSLVQATTDEFAEKNPRAVIGLNRAMMKGLVFTKANPKAAMRMFYEVHAQSRPADVEKQLPVDVGALLGWLDYAYTDQKPVGRFVRDEWAGIQDMALDVGMTTQRNDVARYFDDRFPREAASFDHRAIADRARSMK